jgi:hypothetical protein
MNEVERSELLNRWDRRVKNSRKLFFYEWLDLNQEKKTLQELWDHLYQDIQFLYVAIYHQLKHLKHYAKAVKDEYGVSFFRQFYQLNYLCFKLRQHPKNYRKYHLFKPEVWSYADQFTYSHYPIQKIVARKLFPDELDILLNKLNFHSFCKKHNILTPDILGYSYDGSLVNEKGGFELPDKDIFVKEIAGQMGIGAKKFTYRNGSFRDVYGDRYTKERIVKVIRDYAKSKSEVIIQPVIQNHETWLPFTSGALATCRVVTAKKPGTAHVELLFSALRMPVGNTNVDNYSNGGMVSAIQAETGVLGKAFRSVPVGGKFETDVHPDTGKKITGSKLPGWDEMREFILKLHDNFESPFIGWDVALTSEGAMVLEGSLYWNAGSVEVSLRLPFSKSKYPEYFERWIGEKVDKLA